MTIITAKRRKSDGKLVRIHPDGREEVLVEQPFRPMTDQEVEAAALSDPDNPPMTGEQLKQMKRISPAKRLRWSLGLTQEEFAARYQIPLGTLRDWEQHRTEPDQPARAYLKVITTDPDGVRRALESDAKRSSVAAE